MEKSINPSAHEQCHDIKKSVREHYLTAQTIGVGLVDKVFNTFYDESVKNASPDILDNGLKVAISHSLDILPLPCYSIPKKNVNSIEVGCRRSLQSGMESSYTRQMCHERQ